MGMPTEPLLDIMRRFLDAFVALVEQRHREVGWHDCGAA